MKTQRLIADRMRNTVDSMSELCALSSRTSIIICKRLAILGSMLPNDLSKAGSCNALSWLIGPRCKVTSCIVLCQRWQQRGKCPVCDDSLQSGCIMIERRLACKKEQQFYRSFIEVHSRKKGLAWYNVPHRSIALLPQFRMWSLLLCFHAIRKMDR